MRGWIASYIRTCVVGFGSVNLATKKTKPNVRRIFTLRHRVNGGEFGEFIKFYQTFVSWWGNKLSERHFRNSTMSTRVCTWMKEQQRRKTEVKKRKVRILHCESSRRCCIHQNSSIKRYSCPSLLGPGVRVDLAGCQNFFIQILKLIWLCELYNE